MRDRRSDLSASECSLSDGRTLAYTTGGDPNGDPVVVHHGTPGSRLFGAICSEPAASEGVRLIVPDRPGYGRSTPPPSDWSWVDWRADLHELLDSEGISQAPLIGFSGGGPFAVAAATGRRTTRLGLVSAVIPPANNGLARLSRIPFALQILFGLSKPLARVRGPEAIVRQYTNQSVSETTARSVSDEFHEALRQGPRAVVRETRMFADSAIDSPPSNVPVRAWHGTRDTNTPGKPVQSFLDDIDGTFVPIQNDHLGTFLTCRRGVFEWITESER